MQDYEDAKKQDSKAYAEFFHAMLDHGVYLPPSAFEAWFVSTAHTDADLSRTARAVEESLRVALA